MSELYHHGIQGQKWGIRRYQNSDGTLTEAGRYRYLKNINRMSNKGKSRTNLLKERVIPAGITIYRTSTKSNEDMTGPKYVSYLDVDRDHYKGGWVRKTQGADKAYENAYVLKNDLKIPSRKIQEEVIRDVINSNKKYLYQSVKSLYDMLVPKGSLERQEWGGDAEIKKYIDLDVERIANKSPAEAAFTVCQSFGLATGVRKKIINELSKKGYNAMVDEASVGGRNGFVKEGYDPLIIFDGNNLSQINSNQISEREERKASESFDQWKRRVKNKSAKWSAI